MNPPILLVSAGLLAPKKKAHSFARKHRYLNYGLLTLGTLLHSQGHQVRMFHGGFSHPEVLADRLQADGLLGPGYTIFLSLPSNYAIAWAQLFVQRIKFLCPSARIIVGGRWVVGNDGGWIRNKLSAIDLVVYGTAERRIAELLQSKRWPEIAQTDRSLFPGAAEEWNEYVNLRYELNDDFLTFHPSIALYGAWVQHRSRGGGRVAYKELLDAAKLSPEFSSRQLELTFISEELLDELIEDEEQLKQKYDAVKNRFDHARPAALRNTDLYLSMVEDLDIYVATSMRNREQFRNMSAFCDHIFSDPSIKHYNLRYFDPTLSAARGHEDKGLIECLMVKCAKVLIYMVGLGDSYGKDVEAGMALSQGKPVIFFGDAEHRLKIFQDIHPLSRLVDFKTGVPVGLMATSSLPDVILLLHRIFGNRMQYTLEHRRKGYFRLIEPLTQSVVRVQTDDRRLRETFWNVYHRSDMKVN